MYWSVHRQQGNKDIKTGHVSGGLPPACFGGCFCRYCLLSKMWRCSRNRAASCRSESEILSLKMTPLDFWAGEMAPLFWSGNKSWIYVEKCCCRGENGEIGTKYADFDSKFVRNLLRLCFNRGFQEANLVIIFDIWTAASCKRTKFLFVFILWK